MRGPIDLPLAALALLSGCSLIGRAEPKRGCPCVEVEVSAVDPCGEEVLAGLSAIRFEPEGGDSAAVTTSADMPQIVVEAPLTGDFAVRATGFSAGGEVVARGRSKSLDLSAAGAPRSINVVLETIDAFHPLGCSELTRTRYGLTASYLAGPDKVLIAGGVSLEHDTFSFSRAMELLPAGGGDPALAGEFSSADRAYASATTLEDGRVLIAGGEKPMSLVIESQATAAIVDARDADVHITDVGMMDVARAGHTAVRLADGRVLVAGGWNMDTRTGSTAALSTLEIFDPATGLFASLTDPVSGAEVSLSSARYGHSASVLASGSDVLIAGGTMSTSSPVRSIDVVHVEGGHATIASFADVLGVGPIFHSALLAPDGSVLLAGGLPVLGQRAHAATDATTMVEAWSYDVSSRALTRTCTGAMAAGRAGHTSILVGRQVLFAGGWDPTGTPQATGEVALLAAGSSSCFAGPTVSHAMSSPRLDHAAVELPFGRVLFVGGWVPDGTFGRSIGTSEVFVFAPAE